MLPCKQRLQGVAQHLHHLSVQGPPVAPHSESALQVLGTFALRSGKYWMPTDSPAELVSCRNALMALFTASHLVGPLALFSSIDPEISSMM